jgi:hypothetical protein
MGKTLYDPTTEPNLGQRSSAGRWELLRRNAAFRRTARRWVLDRNFRLRHAQSEDYYNEVVHFPRCALDWMIPADQRIELARHQLSKGHWIGDLRFNFGPITAKLLCPAPLLSHQNIAQSFEVRPRSSSPFCLTLEQAWPETPPAFKDQFVVATRGDVKFEVLTEQLKEVGVYLRWAARRVLREDNSQKRLEIAETLFELGQQLLDKGEFQHVFGIPNELCSSGKLSEYIDAIRKHCFDAGQIVDRYTRHASWLGTGNQWHYFLVAEQRGFDPTNTAHMAQLAGFYSEALKRGLHESTVRPNTKRHGFMGTGVPYKVIRNRRSTVREFITGLQEWIDNIYPPARWQAFTQSRNSRAS